MQSKRPLLIGIVVLVVAGAAEARRLRGEWTDAYRGGGGTVRFIGTFDANAGTVRGRLRCKRGCPVKGQFAPTCTGGGTSWSCSGPVGNPARGCTGNGYVYLDVFEGTWECGPGTGGVLSFGSR